MVFPFEKFLADNLKIYGLLYKQEHNLITKIFHLINSKSIPGQLYATTAPGF